VSGHAKKKASQQLSPSTVMAQALALRMISWPRTIGNGATQQKLNMLLHQQYFSDHHLEKVLVNTAYLLH